MNVVVDGLMTHYLKEGRGEVILCLPGWGDTTSTFEKLIDDLKAHYTVVALDLPGFGGTQAPNEAWDLEKYAKFTADFLKKIKIEKLYAAIGHSYGGATAILGLGSKYFESEKLVLLASSGVRDQKNLKKVLLKVIAKIAKIPLYLLPPSKRRKLRKQVYSAVGSDMLLLPHMEPTFRKIIRQDVRQSAQSLSAETLLIYGSEDRTTPPSDGRLLDDVIPNSSLELIAGAGHFLHHDNSEQVAKLIRRFLKGG